MDKPVDLDNLREITDGDAELEAEFFDEFRSSANEVLSVLDPVANDNETWRKAAHALKGIAMNLGAYPLGELGKQAQEKCEAPSEEKQTMLAEIKAEYQNVLQFLAEEQG